MIWVEGIYWNTSLWWNKSRQAVRRQITSKCIVACSHRKDKHDKLLDPNEVQKLPLHCIAFVERYRHLTLNCIGYYLESTVSLTGPRLHIPTQRETRKEVRQIYSLPPLSLCECLVYKSQSLQSDLHLLLCLHNIHKWGPLVRSYR